MRILLVEDDPMIAESAAESLREEGHDVQRVSDGRNAMAQLKVHGYDFVLLDLGLPGADGMTVLRTLRAAKNTTPVLILTARDALDDRLAGLDAGADDYVVKPFHMSEILARMRAVQRRRFGFEADGNLTNGAVTLIDAEKAAEAGGARIPLSRREYALMAALLARPGAILSRRALEERIYDSGEEPESNAVEYLIHSLRKKLGAQTIKNVRGLGWMVPKSGDRS